MARIILALVLCSLCFSARAAEGKPATLRLKNGQVLEGVVLNESEDSVEFKMGTMKASYTKKEIEEVEYLYVETLSSHKVFAEVAAKNPDLARNEKFLDEASATLRKYPGIPPEAAWDLTAQIFELRAANDRYKSAMWRLQGSREEASREAEAARFDAHQARREAAAAEMQASTSYHPQPTPSGAGSGSTWTNQQVVDQATGSECQRNDDGSSSTRRSSGNAIFVVQKGPIQTPDGRIDPEASANKVQVYGNGYVVPKGPKSSNSNQATTSSSSAQQSPAGEAQMRQAWGWRNRNQYMSDRIKVPENNR